MQPNSESCERRASILGIILSFLTAVLAELILSTALARGDYTLAVGRMALVFLALYSIHRFALVCLRSYRPRWSDVGTILLTLVGGSCLVSVGRILAIGLSTYVENSAVLPSITPESFEFAIPYGVGALLLQAVLGLHYGLVYSVSFAVLLGLYSPGNLLMVPFVLTTSLVACLSLLRFRSRSAYLRAGLNITLISLPFALGSALLDGGVGVADILIRLAGALVSGLLCSFIAAGCTPILESLGGYVTDMRLIEMATIDHPLLKELSIQAPGTWNHSMVMGMMAEAAADAIGANAVLARVGAYFHDIGKMKKPLYFVENQAGGENRHDKLSTSMSALIIRSHVKDGIELAKKHKLPQAIIDMIPQHHGTSVIEFFYSKAQKESKEAGDESGEVDRSLYSYPGPKPQTKEAGILMLADGIEAAARTLSDPTIDRIQGLVQKMMNKVFSSGELSECDLTLRDLHLIAKNFTRVLTSIYHQRIAYAEPAEKVNEKSPENPPKGKARRLNRRLRSDREKGNMKRKWEVHIRNQHPKKTIAIKEVKKGLLKILNALESEELPEQIAELSVLFCSDDEIRMLNRDYRGKDRATDVLSFSQIEGQDLPHAQPMLGDLVVSLDTAERQAREFGVRESEECWRLLAHGLLHLFGYDHENVPEEEAAMMFQLQDALLETTPLPDLFPLEDGDEEKNLL